MMKNIINICSGTIVKLLIWRAHRSVKSRGRPETQMLSVTILGNLDAMAETARLITTQFNRVPVIESKEQALALRGQLLLQNRIASVRKLQFGAFRGKVEYAFPLLVDVMPDDWRYNSAFAVTTNVLVDSTNPNNSKEVFHIIDASDFPIYKENDALSVESDTVEFEGQMMKMSSIAESVSTKVRGSVDAIRNLHMPSIRVEHGLDKETTTSVNGLKDQLKSINDMLHSIGPSPFDVDWLITCILTLSNMYHEKSPAWRVSIFLQSILAAGIVKPSHWFGRLADIISKWLGRLQIEGEEPLLKKPEYPDSDDEIKEVPVFNGQGNGDEWTEDDSLLLTTMTSELLVETLITKVPELAKFEGQSKTVPTDRLHKLAKDVSMLKTLGQGLKWLSGVLWVVVSWMYFKIYDKPLMIGGSEQLVKTAGEWISKTTEYMEKMDRDSQILVRDMGFTHQVVLHFRRGQEIEKDLLESGFTKANFTPFFRSVTAYKIFFEKALSLLRNGTARKPPMAILLTGPPGKGKSVIAEMIARVMYRIDCNDTKTPYDPNAKIAYYRQVDNEFWDDYKSEFACVSDDMMQSGEYQTRLLRALEHIAMCNTAPYPLHIANMEGKQGTYFNSKVIIATTNSTDFLSGVELENDMAFWRRWDLILHIDNPKEFTKYGRLDETKDFDYGAYIITPMAATQMGEEVRVMACTKEGVDKKGHKGQQKIRWNFDELMDNVVKTFRAKQRPQKDINDWLQKNQYDIKRFVGQMHRKIANTQYEAMEAKWNMKDQGRKIIEDSQAKQQLPPFDGKVIYYDAEDGKEESEDVTDEIRPPKTVNVTEWRSANRHLITQIGLKPYVTWEEYTEMHSTLSRAIRTLDGMIDAQTLAFNQEMEVAHNTVSMLQAKFKEDQQKSHSWLRAITYIATFIGVVSLFGFFARLWTGSKVEESIAVDGQSINTLQETQRRRPQINTPHKPRPGRTRLYGGQMDQTSLDIAAKMRNHSLGTIKFGSLKLVHTYDANVIAFGDRTILSTGHLIQYLIDDDSVWIEVRFPGRESYRCMLKDCTSVDLYEDEDELWIELPVTFQPMENIAKHIIPVKELSDCNLSHLLRITRNVDFNNPITAEIADGRRLKEALVTVGKQSYAVANGVTYTVTNQPGDCTGVLLLVNQRVKYKILGFHNGGSGESGVGRLLTRESVMEKAPQLFRNMKSEFDGQMKWKPADGFIGNPPFFKYHGDKIQFVGTVPRPMEHRLQKNGEIGPSLIQNTLMQPITAPSMLSPFMTDEGEYISPMQKAIDKRCKIEHKGDNLVDRDLVERIENIVADEIGFKIAERELTIVEAIQGVVHWMYSPPVKANTAVGWTGDSEATERLGIYLTRGEDGLLYPTQRLIDEVEDLRQKYVRGQKGLVIGVANLKSERLSLLKVKNGETRIFIALPFPQLVLMKMELSSMMENAGHSRHQTGFCVGLNPHSMEWGIYLDELKSLPGTVYPFHGDASGWDFSLYRTFGEAYINVVEKWHERSREVHRIPKDDRFKARQIVKRAMLEDMMDLYVLFYKDLCKVGPIVPSGGLDTFLRNCVINKIEQLYCITKCARRISTALAKGDVEEALRWYLPDREQQWQAEEGVFLNLSLKFQRIRELTRDFTYFQPENYREYIRNIFAGDDFVNTVNDISEWYGFSHLQREARVFYRKWTSPFKGKEEKPYHHVVWEDVIFEQRAFDTTAIKGIVTAPFYFEEQMLEILNWVKNTIDVRQATRDNAETVMREYAHYGWKRAIPMWNAINAELIYAGIKPIHMLWDDMIFEYWGKGFVKKVSEANAVMYREVFEGQQALRVDENVQTFASRMTSTPDRPFTDDEFRSGNVSLRSFWNSFEKLTLQSLNRYWEVMGQIKKEEFGRTWGLASTLMNTREFCETEMLTLEQYFSGDAGLFIRNNGISWRPNILPMGFWMDLVKFSDYETKLKIRLLSRSHYSLVHSSNMISLYFREISDFFQQTGYRMVRYIKRYRDWYQVHNAGNIDVTWEDYATELYDDDNSWTIMKKHHRLSLLMGWMPEYWTRPIKGEFTQRDGIPAFNIFEQRDNNTYSIHWLCTKIGIPIEEAFMMELILHRRWKQHKAYVPPEIRGKMEVIDWDTEGVFDPTSIDTEMYEYLKRNPRVDLRSRPGEEPQWSINGHENTSGYFSPASVNNKYEDDFPLFSAIATKGTWPSESTLQAMSYLKPARWESVKEAWKYDSFTRLWIDSRDHEGVYKHLKKSGVTVKIGKSTRWDGKTTEEIVRSFGNNVFQGQMEERSKEPVVTGEETPNVETKGITTMADLSAVVESSQDGVTPNWTRSANPYQINDTPKAILERQYLVASYTWSNQASQALIGDLNFPFCLFQTSSNLSNKASNFHYMRAGWEIAVRIKGTISHFGSIVVVVGGALPNRNGTNSCKTSNMVTAMTFKHAVISANNSQIVQHVQKYDAPTDWLYVYECVGVDDSLTGFCQIWCLNPLGCVGATSPPSLTINVFARLIDVECAGQTPGAESFERKARIFKPLVFKGQMKSSHDAPVDKEAIAKSKSHTISGLIMGAAGLAIATGTTSLAGPYSLGVKAAGIMGAAIGNMIAKFGYNKPMSLQAPMFTLGRTTNMMANGAGLEMVEDLSFLPDNKTATSPERFGRTQDEMNAITISMKPGYFSSGSFNGTSAVGVVLFSCYVTPMTAYTLDDTTNGRFIVFPTPCMHQAWMYSSWEGTMKYLFKFYSSAFTNYRVMFVFSPDASTLATDIPYGGGDIISEIFEATGDMTVKLSMPFLSQTGLLNCEDPFTKDQYGAAGIVYCVLINPPVINTTTTSSTVYYNIWCATDDDIQYYEPFERVVPSNGWTMSIVQNLTSPTGDIVQQAGNEGESLWIEDIFKQKFPALANATQRTVKHLYAGEKVMDHRTLLHRTEYLASLTMGNTNNWTTLDPFYENNSLIYSTNTFNWINAYAQRNAGSVVLRVFQDTLNQSYTKFTNQLQMIGFLTRRDPEDPNADSGGFCNYQQFNWAGRGGSVVQNFNDKASLEVKIPHYSRYNYNQGYGTWWLNGTKTAITYPNFNVNGMTILMTDNLNTQSSLVVYRCVGDDFHCGVYEGTPILVYNYPDALKKKENKRVAGADSDSDSFEELKDN